MELAREAVRRSFTLVRDRDRRLPLKASSSLKLLLVVAADAGESQDFEPPAAVFPEALRPRAKALTVARLDQKASNLDEILRAAPSHDLVIAAAWASVSAYRGTSGPSPAQALGLEKLSATGALFLGFGNPYGLRGAQAFGTVLLAFDTDPLTEELAAGALFGDFPLTGRLPVKESAQVRLKSH
jgi:hypothetical protein